MKYISFEIHNFKNINLAKYFPENNIVPVIGYNGSGKTNFLESIYWFDIYNQKADFIISNKYYKDKKLKIITQILAEDEHDMTILKEFIVFFKNKLLKNTKLYKEVEAIQWIENMKWNMVLEPNWVNGANYYIDGTKDFFSKLFSEKPDLIYEYNEQIHKIFNRLPWIHFMSCNENREIIKEKTTIDPASYTQNNKNEWFSILDSIIKRFSSNKLLNLEYIINNNLTNFEIETLQKDIRKGLNFDLYNEGIFDFLNGGNAIKTELLFYIHKSDSHNILEIDFSITEIWDKFNRNVSFSDMSTGFKNLINTYLLIAFSGIKKNQIFLLDEPVNFLSNKILVLLWSKMKTDNIEIMSSFVFTTHNPFGINLDYVNTNEILVAEKGSTNMTNIKTINDVNYSDDNIQNYINKILKYTDYTIENISLSKEKINIIVEGLSDYRILKCIIDENIYDISILEGYKKYKYWFNSCIKQNMNFIFIIDTNSDEKEFFSKEVSKMYLTDDILSKYFIFLNDVNANFNQIEDLIEKSEWPRKYHKNELTLNMIKRDILDNKFEKDIKNKLPKTYGNFMSLIENINNKCHN